jgi:hypothetical protein
MQPTDIWLSLKAMAILERDRINAQRLARGVCRALGALGYATLTEFPLISGRRVDVIAINGVGETVIVEIKTSTADYRADRKWSEYLEFCDAFFFAVPPTFPLALLPADCGLMIADDYGAEILRRQPAQAMNATRRRAQTLRVALAAMQRLGRLIDPVSGG